MSPDSIQKNQKKSNSFNPIICLLQPAALEGFGVNVQTAQP